MEFPLSQVFHNIGGLYLEAMGSLAIVYVRDKVIFQQKETGAFSDVADLSHLLFADIFGVVGQDFLTIQFRVHIHTSMLYFGQQQMCEFEPQTQTKKFLKEPSSLLVLS